MESKPSPLVLETWQQLHDEWRNAGYRIDLARSPDSKEYWEQREQTAYDALVDFIEDNGLNFSEWDVRGSDTPPTNDPPS